MEEGILQDVTKDFSKFVGSKGGVEVLDVNDIIKECTDTEEAINENSILVNYIDVPKLTKDLSQVIDVLGTLSQATSMDDEGEMEAEEAPEEGADEMEAEEAPAEEEAEAEEAQDDPNAMPGEEGEEMDAKDDEEGDVVGDDAESSVGLGKEKQDVTSIMSNLDGILAALGGKEEDKEEDMPEDQYGS
jgi:hypothetical protein